jgi:pimeloyl-ACP methyl ester carboxylesterase
MSIQFLNTHPDRFSGLPEFAYQPNFLGSLPSFAPLNMAYIDEPAPEPEQGQSTGQVALCIHGQPTWSYLYRKMIEPFRQAGFRVVAPDLFGFGRSDKPVDPQWYSFDRHRQSLIELIQHLDLRNITLVVQDWGGLLGLTLPHQMPERFKQLLVMNTTLGTGDVALTQGFLDWRAYIAAQTSYIDCGKIIGRGTPHLSAAEIQAYDAPFENVEQQAGVRRFPQLVPEFIDSPGALVSRLARHFWREQWQGESFMVVGMKDPVLGMPVMRGLSKLIRRCPAPYQIDLGGHFVQEWQSEQCPIVQLALQSFVNTVNT